MGVCDSLSLIMGTVLYQSCNHQNDTIMVSIWATASRALTPPCTTNVVSRKEKADLISINSAA
jgi:hypothetical protein